MCQLCDVTCPGLERRCVLWLNLIQLDFTHALQLKLLSCKNCCFNVQQALWERTDTQKKVHAHPLLVVLGRTVKTATVKVGKSPQLTSCSKNIFYLLFILTYFVVKLLDKDHWGQNVVLPVVLK